MHGAFHDTPLGNQSYDHRNKDSALFQMWHYFANIFQW
jgi:hypothetical protein